jgi:cobalamin biosynthesis protein CbiG
MVPPGPQLDAKVADPLHSRLVLDLAEELERLDAELAGLVNLTLINTDRGLVGEIAGALLGRVRVQRTNGLRKHGVSTFRLGQADVHLALETGQP